MEIEPPTILAFFSLAIVLIFLAAIGMSDVAMAEEEIIPSTAVARLKIARGTG